MNNTTETGTGGENPVTGHVQSTHGPDPQTDTDIIAAIPDTKATTTSSSLLPNKFERTISSDAKTINSEGSGKSFLQKLNSVSGATNVDREESSHFDVERQDAASIGPHSVGSNSFQWSTNDNGIEVSVSNDSLPSSKPPAAESTNSVISGTATVNSRNSNDPPELKGDGSLIDPPSIRSNGQPSQTNDDHSESGKTWLSSIAIMSLVQGQPNPDSDPEDDKEISSCLIAPSSL